MSTTTTPARPAAEASAQPGFRARRREAKAARARAAAQVDTTSKTRSEYRPDIDGIRGAAAIMVMGFHAKVPGFEGAYIGLDLFFVVSGYVIAGLLMHEYARTGTIRWGAFYARRARRLIPAKATMIIGVLIISYFVLTPTGGQQETARSAAAAAGFVSNFFFWQASNIDYFGHEPGTAVLLHTWSLSVEEQFYLALPLLLLLAWFVGRLLRIPPVRTILFTTLALGIASAWLAISWADSFPDAAYYLPITRAFEFLIGVALALVVRKVRLAEDLREVMGLAGAAICAFVLWKPMPVEGYPSYWALLPCAGAALLVWAGVGGPTAVTRFLSMKFLVGLGLISYGWYLWHWPFLVFGEAYNVGQPPLWARVMLIIAALGVAVLSYRFVEGLFYKRSGSVSTGRTWGPRRVMISGVVAMSCVAGLSGGAVLLAERQGESPYWEAVTEQLSDYPQMPAACLEEDEYIPERPQRCDLVPFERGRPTMVLWGDSHAWMYIPAIEAAARSRDVNLVAFVKGACPPYIPPEGNRLSCSRLNDQALRFVANHVDDRSPMRVMMSFSYETYRGSPQVGLFEDRVPDIGNPEYIARMSELMEYGTPRLFQELSELGAMVDVVGPTPIIPRNAPLCEARSRPFSCDVPRDEAIRDEDENVAWLESLMAGLPGRGEDGGPRFIDVARALCDEDYCFAEADGVVNYFDDNHLSARMSRTLKPFFAASLELISPTSPGSGAETGTEAGAEPRTGAEPPTDAGAQPATGR